ncbi:hypothetical protein ACIQGZ_26640 [Streptomyces sp. NPDC092296]|uniref:hypothetical protein n=1 Tax=Streptomyces sp. NPDC092296 TaxID=3366012 RepID=UPI0037F9F3BE
MLDAAPRAAGRPDPGPAVPRRPAARPGPYAGAADLCPDTGRSRLSYERAEYLFKQATKVLDPAGSGYTLRQLAARD